MAKLSSQVKLFQQQLHQSNYPLTLMQCYEVLAAGFGFDTYTEFTAAGPVDQNQFNSHRAMIRAQELRRRLTARKKFKRRKRHGTPSVSSR